MNRGNLKVKNNAEEKTSAILLSPVGAYASQDTSKNSVQLTGDALNLFERTKVYRKIQLKKRNIYEKKFYDILLNLRVKFKPQYPISPYIVDIFIPIKGLIIEIDGAIHNHKINQIRDASREEYLSSFGLFIIRHNTSSRDKIQDFIHTQLKIFPDLTKKRISVIRKNIAMINNIAKIKGFKVVTTNSYSEILSFYHQWRKIEKLKKEFPNWAKNVLIAG